MKISQILLIIVILTVAIGFNVWLDYGCEVNGMITWSGKECF